MVRTQIQLTDEQAASLKRVARDRGVSIAQIIREALDDHLGVPVAESRRERALRVVGRFRSGRPDVSARHDDELSEAFGP